MKLNLNNFSDKALLDMIQKNLDGVDAELGSWSEVNLRTAMEMVQELRYRYKERENDPVEFNEDEEDGTCYNKYNIV